uniref:SH3 domain-containing protein n=1 Tax=Phreatobacter sp. TaxID=1966341 RepID=UPI0025F216E3
MAFDLGRLLPLAGSLIISTFTVGAALAQDAVTTGAVNLRAGPGTQFPRVTTLPAGAGVDITSCSGAWCRVVYRGITGFVSRNLLDEDSVVVAPPRRIYVEPPVYVRPRIYVEPPFYADPPFYPSYRPGWRPPYRYDRPGFGPRPGWHGGGGGRPGHGPGWHGGGG